VLVFVQGGERRNVILNRTPFSVGRKGDRDLVIDGPYVSRAHVQIVLETQWGARLTKERRP
jgi:pSer/pThr/pTyr-binding forkhead associated (FHA) protein